MPKIKYIFILLFSIVLISNNLIAAIKLSAYNVNATIKSTAVNPATASRNLSVLATSASNKLQVLGFWFVNSGLTYSEDLIVTRMAFNNFLFDAAEGNIPISDLNIANDIEPGLMGDPLFYPNPLRFSKGGILQFITTQEMDIEILMYDIFGHQIYRRKCIAGGPCGQRGINNLMFNAAEFNGYELSAGVYFYLFVFEGEVIGRGKLAVVP